MLAVAFSAVVAIFSWITFWTASHPSKWQAKKTEGVVAAFAAVLAIVASAIMAEGLVYGFGGYALLASLAYLAFGSWKAHKARPRNTTEQARLHW